MTMFVLIAELPDYMFEDEDEAEHLGKLQLVAKAETKDELIEVQAIQEQATKEYWDTMANLALSDPLKNAKEAGITTHEDYKAYVNEWNAALKSKKAEVAKPKYLDCNFYIF